MSNLNNLAIDPNRLIAFLVGLLNTPSPTGYHAEVIPFVEQHFRALNIPGATFRHTNKGALVIDVPGAADTAPRALTAHVDTLGAMVAEVKNNGRLRLTQLGGYMWNALENESVTIRTQDNRRYRGSVLTVKASTHAYGRDAEQLARSAETMEVRIDVRSQSAAETRAHGIEVGDFVFLDPRVEVTESGFIRSRHLDDKASVAAIYAAFGALVDAHQIPAQRTTLFISNYEEVGHGASAGLPSDLVELLVVDMAVLGSTQNSDEFTAGICIKDSGGPYHFEMNRTLIRLAQTHDILYKLDVYPFYGSDGEAYWRAGGDVRVGLIGPGVDASHAYERTHIDGLMHTAQLAAQYVLDAASVDTI